MNELTGVIFVLKSATVVLGGLITFYAYKAYNRTGARALRVLSIGFAIITLGSLLGGFVDQLLVTTREWAIVIESILAVMGFGVVFYSLHAD